VGVIDGLGGTCAITRPVNNAATKPAARQAAGKIETEGEGGFNPLAKARTSTVALATEKCLALKEYDFTGCGKTDFERQEVSGHDFTGCGKTDFERQEVSGHDFSRAENATKQRVGFSPCGMLFGILATKHAFFRSLFSRTVSAATSAGALAPEACFSGFSLENRPFPAAHTTAHPLLRERTKPRTPFDLLLEETESINAFDSQRNAANPKTFVPE
jgi:hypothetical protein